MQEKSFLEAEYQPLKGRRCCFNWCGPNRRTVDGEHNRMRSGQYEGGRSWGFWSLMISIWAFIVGCLPMPVVWWERIVERVSLPWFDWHESMVSVGLVNVTAWIPSFNLFNAQYNADVFRWCLSYSMWHLPLRVAFWALALSMLVSSARAAPLKCPVEQMYTADRFSPIVWQGPLPLNCGHSFGLPGTISERKLTPLAEDCGMKILEDVVCVKEDAYNLFATWHIVTGKHRDWDTS